MIYLTYNDQPSGVYSSQVCDVCNFLNNQLNAQIKLVAFISLHDFFKNRKKIKDEFKGAIVIPAIPKAKYWKFSAAIFTLFCFLNGERKVISRNIIATHLALIAKRMGAVKLICLDGRGAIAAEWHEYQVVPDKNMKRKIAGQEKIAVQQSDFRIAVSNELVKHWNDAYDYSGVNHVVVPCTLSSGFSAMNLDSTTLKRNRTAEGFNDEDIIMVYSGSTAGWQSFNTLGVILGRVLAKGKNFKLLFLSRDDENITGMKSLYPGQVFSKWVKHNEVQQVLSACDYGILYREQSITNMVASPTKFAEYLSAGLPVIISENLGDYSDFVLREKCGILVSESEGLNLEKPTQIEKSRAIELAVNYFTKQANINQYKTLINFINNN